MLPVLFHFPAKAALVLSMVAAAGGIVGRQRLARWMPRWALASLLLLAALIGPWILWFQSPAWLPWGDRLVAPWPPITVYSYPALLLVAYVLGWAVLRRQAHRQGESTRPLLAIYVIAALWSLIGGRALYLLTVYRSIVADGLSAVIHRGGMVAYGGMIVGSVATLWACRRRGMPFLKFADLAVPSVAIGTAVTRFGCFLFGCDFGAPSNVAWTVRFPIHSPAWVEHVSLLGLPSTASHSFPVHPTQVYEAFIALAVYVLLALGIGNRGPAGERFALWWVMYGSARAIIEVFRGDSDRGSVGAWSTSQIIALSTVALAVGFILLRRRRGALAPTNERPG